MFDDRRGRKVAVLAHCILNQNAKLDRCAHCAGAVREVVEVLLENGIGILQMECPEMLHLGLDRQTDKTTNPSVEAEDTRIARRMEEPPAQRIVERIAQNVVQQIADYQAHGFSVIGMLGINGSPSWLLPSHVGWTSGACTSACVASARRKSGMPSIRSARW